MTITPPQTMTGAERKAYRKLARQLVAAGLDVAAKAATPLPTTCWAEARISELRAHEARSKGRNGSVRRERLPRWPRSEDGRMQAALQRCAEALSATVEDEVASCGRSGRRRSSLARVLSFARAATDGSGI